MKRLLTVLTLLVCSTPAPARVVDGIAAVVDGAVITRSEVEELARARERLGPGRDKDSRSEALDALIEKALLAKEADRLGLSVSDQDVEGAVAEIRRRNGGMDEAAFRAAIEGQGLAYEAYLVDLRTQILRVKLAGQVLRSRVRTDNEAVREYYLKHAGDYSKPTRVRLGHAEVADRGAADELRRRLVSGETPETAAPGYKDMGFLDAASLSEDVRAAVAGLQPGGVSPVVELAGAFHLFVLIDETKSGTPSYDDLTEDQRQAVKNRFMDEQEEELYRTWIDSLRQKAKIERPGS